MKDKMPLDEDFSRLSDSIYEAVMVIAKRARKIGADQKFEVEKLLSTQEPEKEDEEEPVVENRINIELEKPTIIALRELSNDELEFEYKEKS